MTQSAKHVVKSQRTGRFFTLGSVQPLTKTMWIAFHGYGQLAEYFIKHFEELPENEHFIVAPEGLSRFYIDGLTGRVGASWMTKIDREAEIIDQSNYINEVMNASGIELADREFRFVVLAFSQGTATAVRWMVNNNIRPDALVLWAGSFPHDVNAAEHPHIFKALPTYFVYGDEDPFLKDIDLDSRMNEFQNMGVDLRLKKFKGQHTLDKPTLAEIVHSFDTL